MEDGRDDFATGVDNGLPTMVFDYDDPGSLSYSDFRLGSFNAQELLDTPIGGAIDHKLEEADERMERKRKQSSEEVAKINDQKSRDQATRKKPRFIWTTELHNRFLDAMKELGYKKAVPTKILRVMNVAGLTRENVASHLQKFRLQMKKQAQEQRAGCDPPQDDSKTCCPLMCGISQQASVLPNMTMMQGRSNECAYLNPPQQVSSFPNQNLNMLGVYPTIQEGHGMQFKDVLFDGGINRTRGVEVVHGFRDRNGPYNLDELAFSGRLPPQPLVDPSSSNYDATLVSQCHRLDELSLADQGIRPSLAQNTEGLGGGLVQSPLPAMANHLDGMNDYLATHRKIFDVKDEFCSFDAGTGSSVNWIQDLEDKGIDDLFLS